jgi:hypothetical protein
VLNAPFSFFRRRLAVSFWQVVSSFSSTMYVPWPSVYYALASSLNVASLQFLNLPAISCISPGVSFLTVFNGVTISTALFVLFCAAVYELGQRSAAALADDDRRRRFKTRVSSVFIWGLFFVYPQARPFVCVRAFHRSVLTFFHPHRSAPRRSSSSRARRWRRAHLG